MAKLRGDPFDLAAKDMYTMLDKIERVFRSKNIKVSVWVDVDSDDFESVGWNGIRSIFECRTISGKKHPIRDVVPTAPWVGGLLMNNLFDLYTSCIKEKSAKTEYLEEASRLAQHFIDTVKEL